jgi:hypothetical protein
VGNAAPVVVLDVVSVAVVVNVVVPVKRIVAMKQGTISKILFVIGLGV